MPRLCRSDASWAVCNRRGLSSSQARVVAEGELAEQKAKRDESIEAETARRRETHTTLPAYSRFSLRASSSPSFFHFPATLDLPLCAQARREKWVATRDESKARTLLGRASV